MNIYIETYGCTANKSDERLLIGLVTKNHHHVVHEIDTADVLILLTCTVIGTTEQRMLSRLTLFQKTHKKIIVSGCMPTVQADLITAIAPKAILLPCQYIQHINDILFEKKPLLKETKKTALPKTYDTLIAPIMIAEGCRFSCAYCITRFARGKLRSFPIQEIVSDVTSAIHQGCKEIQLTAQDTASYGLDRGENLGTLLSQITHLKEEFRIRIGMMNPATLHENLSSILSAYQHEKIYKFLHLPVQSGDDEMLKKMNRMYTTKQFYFLIEQFRKKIPLLTLSTDIITGFPTESEEHFLRTISLLESIQPDIVNITRFSARPLTTAKKMKGRLPTHIVKERSRHLTEICQRISFEKNKNHLGKICNVLTTENGKNNTVIGRTEQYKPVILTEPVSLGKFLSIEIIDTTSTYLLGKLI